MKLARAYLGADPEYHGLVVFRLAGRNARYMNTAFHHDGCGNRLKAFIYLNDVDENTFPTVIASGSHRTQWYPPTQFFYGPSQVGHNKLNETVVRQNYAGQLKQMLGKMGGGFIFTSNTIHGHEVPVDPKARDVIIMEFSTARHQDGILNKVHSPVSEHGAISGFQGYCGGT
eukprot:gnl/TRDRNA2_/TRDRNA2_176386_c0_seq4.p1 gnl/TRDRNA2_/TRDRNA2_176386_c0~~gnl/TRDRNA2_/TRDRNA2_176386_c0_seq4.p1  ORF type:complete len:172 (-),score=11.65 gnl/TRDRNA2_/TRDRNA2_176386_c0_seq4:77-592(-)